MLSRKLRSQWRLMPVLIVLLYSGSLLLKRNQHEVYFERTTSEPSLMLTTSTSFRYVTKSLKELGKMDDINKYVLLLNHAPYCGAEVLIFILQKLQGKNSYRHVRLKDSPAEALNISQQVCHFIKVI